MTVVCVAAVVLVFAYKGDTVVFVNWFAIAVMVYDDFFSVDRASA